VKRCGWLGSLVRDFTVATSTLNRRVVGNNLRKVVHTDVPLPPSSIIWYRRKPGRKQAHNEMHQPRIPGLEIIAGVWLNKR